MVQFNSFDDVVLNIFVVRVIKDFSHSLSNIEALNVELFASYLM